MDSWNASKFMQGGVQTRHSVKDSSTTVGQQCYISSTYFVSSFEGSKTRVQFLLS